jgi:hypothetical protein
MKYKVPEWGRLRTYEMNAQQGLRKTAYAIS